MIALTIFPVILILSQPNGIFAVQGGVPATIGQFPAHVAIDFPNNTFCAGTIIHQNHVLTVANCAVNDQLHLAPANQTFIRAGILTLTNATGRVAVTGIFVHPLYNPLTLENNLAILRTAISFTFATATANPVIAQANVQNHLVADGVACFIVGWNPTPANPQPNLAFLTVSILNRDALCNSAQNHNGRVSETMMCARGAQANQGVCLSNRGGGLYCGNRLTGVLSFAFGCGTNNQPGVYVQVRMYENWIQQQLRRTNIPAAGLLPIPNKNNNNDSGCAIIQNNVLITLTLLCCSYILLKWNL